MADALDFRKEEYLTLRKEIENCLAELSTLERNCVVATAMAYAWVATAGSMSGSIVGTAWLVPAILPIYGAARSEAIGEHLNLLGQYLRTVEKKALPSQNTKEQEGWEHFFDKHGKQTATKLRKQFWISLIVLSGICSVLGFVVS